MRKAEEIFLGDQNLVGQTSKYKTTRHDGTMTAETTKKKLHFQRGRGGLSGSASRAASAWAVTEGVDGHVSLSDGPVFESQNDNVVGDRAVF